MVSRDVLVARAGQLSMRISRRWECCNVQVGLGRERFEVRTRKPAGGE